MVEGSNPDEPREYVEQVAKFTLRHFQQVFEPCGLTVNEVYGDYDLNRYYMFGSLGSS